MELDVGLTDKRSGPKGQWLLKESAPERLDIRPWVLSFDPLPAQPGPQNNALFDIVPQKTVANREDDAGPSLIAGGYADDPTRHVVGLHHFDIMERPRGPWDRDHQRPQCRRPARGDR